MKPRKHFLLGMVSALIFLWLGIPATGLAENIRIGGSGFGLGVMKILAMTYERSHPGVTIQVIPSLGSAGGIKALGQGALDIAISGRQPTVAEAGNGMVAEEIARTPFAFMANKQASTEGVTIGELERIYGGQITAWTNGVRIRPILRPESDTVTKMVRGISPAMNRAVTLAMSREGMIHAVTDQESAVLAEKTPGAFEGGTLTQVYSEKRQVKVLSFNGVKPSVRGIADGSYPLSIPLYLVMPSSITPAARKFVAYIRSGAGSAILTNNGNLVVMGKKGVKR